MEPEIYRTTGMFGTILENVGMDIEERRIDLNDATSRKTPAPPTRSPPSPGSPPRAPSATRSTS